MEPNLSPLEVSVNGEKKALITSPEYALKKLVASGVEKVYSIGPTFRNFEEGSHNRPEFMMLEWYAPGGYDDLMQETEELLNYVLEIDESWTRFNFDEAKVDEDGDPHVDEKRFFVTNYPVEQAALSKIRSQDPISRLDLDKPFAERFEAFADGMEMCNGFAELTDSTEQRKRFEKEAAERKAAGKTVFPIDEEFLQALDSIEVPIYGNALGLDRLVMLKYGIHNIDDIQIFPTNYPLQTTYYA
jgi:lysyl-tRNA synthetase class 2